MDNEIIKTKKEIKFYIKESVKYFGIFTLTYIKQIALLILSIINCLIPAVISVVLLFSSIPVIVSLITLLYCTLTHGAIKKKLDNYTNNQFFNDITQIEEKINDAGYNLGESYRKLRKLQEDNTHQEEIINNEIVQDVEEKETENKDTKYSYNFTDSYKSNDNHSKEQETKKDVKKLTKKK